MKISIKFLIKAYQEQADFLKSMLEDSNYRDYLYIGPLGLEDIIQKFEHEISDLKNDTEVAEMEIENEEFKRQIDYLEVSLESEMMQDIKLGYNAITQMLVFGKDDFIFTDYEQRVRTIIDDSGFKGKIGQLIPFIIGKKEDAHELKGLIT